MALAAPQQGMSPSATYLAADTGQTLQVAGDRMVVEAEVTLHHAVKPLLRTYPTSHPRRWQDCGYSPSLPRPTVLCRARMRPPSFCARDFPACSGSSTARGQNMTGDSRHAPFCLPLRLTASAPRIPDFAAQWLACRFPLSTLQLTPHDARRMTRGRNDSPDLFRIELSSTISCQLCWRTKH